MVANGCASFRDFGLRGRCHRSFRIQSISRINAARILFLAKKKALASQTWLLFAFRWMNEARSASSCAVLN